MGKTRYAVLDASGNLISVHDTEDEAILDAHAGGAERVFDGAGHLLSGAELPPDPPEPPPPSLPAVRPWRPRDPDAARLVELLPHLELGEEGDTRNAEVQDLVQLPVTDRRQ